MDWIEVQKTCLLTLEWVVRLGVIFGVLSWLMPCNRGMFWWKSWRGTAADLFYLFATPVVVPLIVRGTQNLLLAAGLVLLLNGNPGFDAVRGLPIWQQCILILLIQDVMLYWIHRGFHRRLGWRFHAIHHSPTTLDWPSAARFHIVNYVLSFLLVDAVVLLLGFQTKALMWLIIPNIYYSSMVHANLNWTFGPLRFVFASPVFHRWHHVAEGEGSNKNFASTFAFLDLLFGTFHLPAGEVPQNFGNGEHDFPEDFWGQLIYPFWRRNATADPTNWTQDGLAIRPTNSKRRFHPKKLRDFSRLVFVTY